MPTQLLFRQDARKFLAGYHAANNFDCVITDPPYEALEKHRRIGTKARLKDNWFPVLPNDELQKIFKLLHDKMKPNAHLYVFTNADAMFDMVPLVTATGFKFWRPVVWDKRATGMGYHYRSRVEYVLFFEKGKRALNDKRIPDLLSFKRPYGAYPTQKPVELIKLLIENSTNENELVFDPFYGSGTTAVAAKIVNRHFVGCDVSKHAHEVALDRLGRLNTDRESWDYHTRRLARETPASFDNQYLNDVQTKEEEE